MFRRGFPLYRLALAAALVFGSNAVLAGTVTVITSFPKELTAAYKAAFEKANPDIRVEILNKNTVAGIAFVRETAAGQRPDVFWASAPDAFEVLKRDKPAADGLRRRQQGDPREDRQLSDQRSEGLLQGPGARRLRDHVQHALPEGEQAGRAEGVG